VFPRPEPLPFLSISSSIVCTRLSGPRPIYITGIKNVSPLIQLLEQIAKQQYKIKALADSQIKVQPKASECYGTTAATLNISWYYEYSKDNKN
jgi:hypothetical protein